MDQSTLEAFGDIVWGALFAYLGIIAAVCILLLLRYRAVRPFRLWGGRERVEARAPWRERIRNALLVWHLPWK